MRRGRNEGDEAVATAGAAVTQAQEQGQRFEHQATSAMMPLHQGDPAVELGRQSSKSWVTTTNAVPSSRLSSHKELMDSGGAGVIQVASGLHPPAPGWVPLTRARAMATAGAFATGELRTVCG